MLVVSLAIATVIIFVPCAVFFLDILCVAELINTMATARKHVLFPNLRLAIRLLFVSVPVDREHIYSCDIPTIQ